MSSEATHGSRAGQAPREPAWPVLSGPVPPLAAAFTPRHESVPGLGGGLAPGETLVLVPSAESARMLGRLGGTGATQLAVAIARALWDQGLIDLLVWVPASGRDAVVTSYARALADIGAPDLGEGPEPAAAHFLSWLASTDRPWLVVFDDLADAAVMEGLWPAGAAGRVVVTSRHATTAVRAQRPRVAEVGTFSRREALAYLTTKLNADPDQRLGALDLATDLGFLPIALAQAAAVISETGMDCRQYRARLAEHRRLYPAGEGYGWAVTATWSLAAELADQSAPSGLAVPCLALTSLMDDSGIPGAVLTSQPARAYLAGRRGVPAVDDAQVRAALHSLARVGLVAIDTASASRTVRVHAHVQAIVRELLPPSDLEQTALAAADSLLAAWPRRDLPSDFEQALRDCTAHVREAGGPVLWQPECHPLLLRAGRSLDAAGLAEAGATYWQAMLGLAGQVLPSGHAQLVLIRDRLAAACEASGRADEAISVYEEALADRERALHPGHPDTLAAAGSLARAYRAAGRYEEGLRLAERTLAECERLLGPGHPDTLTAHAELGEANLAAGRLEEAISVLEEVLTAREQVSGPLHPDTLEIRASLAHAFRVARQFREAISLYERILVDRERAQGPDHPDTLAARAGLASAYRAAGRLKDAIPFYRRTLAGRERVQGPDHPDTLTARGNLAAAYLGANKVKDAIPLLERTLAGRERVQGPDHPDTITARGNLASAYHSARKMASAIPLYERTLADCERVLGPGHPDTLASRGNLAHAYHIVGRLTEAIALFERTAADCERVLGPDHPLTRTARENLAAAG